MLAVLFTSDFITVFPLSAADGRESKTMKLTVTQGVGSVVTDTGKKSLQFYVCNTCHMSAACRALLVEWIHKNNMERVKDCMEVMFFHSCYASKFDSYSLYLQRKLT